MDKLFSDNFVNCSRGEIPGLLHSPDSLRNHAGSEFLALADPSVYRHFQSPQTLTKERQRSVLEKLIAVVDPIGAAEIASALLAEFISIGRVMGGSVISLQRVVGDNLPVINLLHTTQRTLVDGLLSEVPLQLVASTDQRLLDYLVATMGFRSHEILRVMFLNQTDHLIADEVLATGSASALTVYPRNIFKRVFELSASAILVVHNHPGGSIEPSDADMHFTAQLANLCTQLEIEIKDHIIIAGSKWFSFHRRGLL